MQANKQTCAKCQLPVAQAERLGSFTSFVFMDLHCQCHKSAKPALNAGKTKAASNSCKTCGKVIPSVNRPGSITSFLLKDLRCNCPKSIKGSEALLRTRYVPARATLTRKRQLLQTAMRTRQANLTASDARLIDLKPGELIGGCYRLADLVGKGGMGLIYKAKHQSLDRTVALKFIAPSLVSKENWELFKKEAKISSSLSHNTICQIYDLGLHAGVLPFYAMDFIDGQTLEEIILSSGPLSVGATLEIFTRVAEGLSYAHRRSVVHKDIKPANIMVTNNEQGLQVKILDFGIAELNEGRKAQAETNIIYGSAAYMSPEQFRGLKLDQRADIYSLGCAMYETLTGMPPFQDETYEDLCESHKRTEAPLLKETTGIDYPIELEAIVQKCLRKRQEKRYQSANEVAVDLQRLLEGNELQFAGDQIVTLTETEQDVAGQSANKKPLLILATAVLILAFTCIAMQLIGLSQSRTIASYKINAKDWEPELNTTPRSTDLDVPQTAPSLPVPSKRTKDNEFFVSEVIDPADRKSLLYQFPPLSNTAILELTGSDFGVFGFRTYGLPGTGATSSKKPDRGVSFKCSGQALIPAFGFLTLRIFDLSAVGPDFIKGFRPQDIQGLDLRYCTENSKDLSREAVLRFPRLERLVLSDSQESDPTIKQLSNFTKIKQLALVDWYCPSKGVPYVSLFPHLKTLYVDTKGSLSGLLRFYLGDSTFQTIIINDALLTPEDTYYLANLKTLKSISFCGCGFKGHCLPELFKSQSISSVHIWNDYFSPYDNGLNSIKASSALKELHIYSQKPATAAALGVLKSLGSRGIKYTWKETSATTSDITE